MKLFLTVLVALCLAAVPASAAEKLTPPDLNASPAAKWIWGSRTEENQALVFRKWFELPAGVEVKSAILWGSCDNAINVQVNAKPAAQSEEWKEPVLVDVKPLLQPGRNLVSILGRNVDGSAAVIAKLEVTLSDGRKIVVATDDTWAAGDVGKNWQELVFDETGFGKPRILGDYGMAPWGVLGAAAAPGGRGNRNARAAGPTEATTADKITTLPGFKVERLYSVPKATQGSWVSMCLDPRGRLIVCDQNGMLYRVTTGATEADTKVEPIDIPLGHAQGLLWAFDSLYVTVNGKGIAGNGPGFYRVRDTNNDDKLDQVTLLRKLEGSGEHGGHGIRLGPDNKLYLVAGNFTKVPNPVPTSPHRNWAEDLLLPRNPDGGGHDPHIWAPGGWVARTDADGKNWELVAAGMRNAYDIDFNLDGELFSYDSDMEWDTGAPWYRPTRVNHIVSGAEYGWRNGTGKWPDFYPDSLGAVVNTGLGSPTGTLFGTGAKFPPRYQHAFFILDWTHGRILAVHMRPEGASYKGSFETFVEGRPLPVTDATVGADGNLYFAIGGRNTQSGLYRVSYTGTEVTAPAKLPVEPVTRAARELRRKLESFHGKQDPAAVDLALANLNSNDRAIRYAARVALEWQDPALWRDKVLAEQRPTALINGLIAVIRSNSTPAKTPATRPSDYSVVDASLRNKVLEALNRLNLRSINEEQLLEALRVYGLAMTRLGHPDTELASRIVDKLDPLFPATSTNVNREVVQLLVALEAPNVIAKTMAILQNARTQEDQLHFAFVLRNLKTNWTPGQRRAYFSFLNLVEQEYRGGASFKKFVIRIRQDAERTLTPEEHATLKPLIETRQVAASAVQDVKPRKFVRNWQMHDFSPADLEAAAAGRDFKSGKEALAAVQCLTCHRFANDGGATGPDLTALGTRFSAADLLESILQPNKVISDQYVATEVLTKDKDILVGRIEADEPDALVLRTHPLSPETIRIPKARIAEQRPSKISTMPEGMVDVLKKEEILDLIAYLRSAGNEKDKAFQK